MNYTQLDRKAINYGNLCLSFRYKSRMVYVQDESILILQLTSEYAED